MNLLLPSGNSLRPEEMKKMSPALYSEAIVNFDGLLSHERNITWVYSLLKHIAIYK